MWKKKKSFNLTSPEIQYGRSCLFWRNGNYRVHTGVYCMFANHKFIPTRSYVISIHMYLVTYAGMGIEPKASWFVCRNSNNCYRGGYRGLLRRKNTWTVFLFCEKKKTMCVKDRTEEVKTSLFSICHWFDFLHQTTVTENN